MERRRPQWVKEGFISRGVVEACRLSMAGDLVPLDEGDVEADQNAPRVRGYV